MIDQTQIYDYGLIVPEGTSVAVMSPEIQAVIADLKAEFPSSRIFGTVPAEGKQTVYVRMQRKLSETELMRMFAAFGLSWQVIGIRSAYRIIEEHHGQDEFGNNLVDFEYDEITPVNKAAILPFVPGATMDTQLLVPVYAGTEPIAL